MGFLDIFKSNKSSIKDVPNVESTTPYTYQPAYGVTWPIVTKKWDGEKTPGELGNVIKNLPDYKRLRLRAYDAEMRIDNINIITSRYFKWVIGSGLKLQSEPNKKVLELEGIDVNLVNFRTSSEARFDVYANSKRADFSGNVNLHSKAMECFSTSFLGGDSLVVCRIDKNDLTIQVIDGQHVMTPDVDMLESVKSRSNYESYGIEFNSKGEHVAYFVKVKSKDELNVKFERIEARGKKTNMRLAWLVYGGKHRIDHTRGITRLSHILEKVNKLDRYTEATVSKAEQGANIVFSIEHGKDSTGQSVLDDIAKKKLRISGEDTNNSHVLGDALANTITQTTSNQTFNMPNDSKLVPYQSKVESDFKEFHDAIFSGICASVSMPPEVAMQQYNSNYSASRAAINSWGYIVDIDRADFANQFYKPIYSIWLQLQILTNNIEAPGYIESIKSGNYMVTDSYEKCRFTGKNMPHIDPLKEVKAVRAMLGEDETPLISREQATENLNAGNWADNYTANLKEDEIILEPENDSDLTEGNNI